MPPGPVAAVPMALGWRGEIGIPFQPFLNDVVVILLAPKHPGKGLALDQPGIGTQRGWDDLLIVFVRFTFSSRENLIEVGFELIFRRLAVSETHLDDPSFIGLQRTMIIGGGLGAHLFWVDGLPMALHEVAMDAIFDVRKVICDLAGGYPSPQISRLRRDHGPSPPGGEGKLSPPER